MSKAVAMVILTLSKTVDEAQTVIENIYGEKQNLGEAEITKEAYDEVITALKRNTDRQVMEEYCDRAQAPADMREFLKRFLKQHDEHVQRIENDVLRQEIIKLAKEKRHHEYVAYMIDKLPSQINTIIWGLR
jgi:hypothetical protein